MRRGLILFVIWQGAGIAQEASSGFEFHGTFSGAALYTRDLTEAPRFGAPFTASARGVLYPTLKIDDHWTISGALALQTRPYNYEDFGTQGYGVKGEILQLNLAYSRSWNNRSLVFRAGQLSSAFGSFLLRYDDAVNPLIGLPPSYGYYGAGITILGLAGAQVDAVLGKLDMRAQFVNSSPANRRSIFDRDQYGNWAGGVGYTISQGFRIGVSSYRGPYLDRQFPFYFPGEAKPRDLPGSAYGLEAQWGRGPWNAYGELQKFQFEYRAIPTFNENTGYAELRRVLHPRWYVAARIGYMHTSASPAINFYETALGFRPNACQLFKIGYEIQQGPAVRGSLDNVFAVQFVTVLHSVSIAHE